MANECGTCTLCCKQQNIPELSKPKCVLCEHAKVGCTIYATRPGACRTYECLWLSEGLAPELKPNLISAAFERGGEGIVTLRTEPFMFNLVLPNPAIMAEVRRRLRAGEVVQVTDGTRANVFVCDRDSWGYLQGTLRADQDPNGETLAYDFKGVLANGPLRTLADPA